MAGAGCWIGGGQLIGSGQPLRGEWVGRHDQRAIHVHGGLLLLCLLPLVFTLMLFDLIELKCAQCFKPGTACSSTLSERHSRSQRHRYQQGDGSEQEERKKRAFSFHASPLFSCASGTSSCAANYTATSRAVRFRASTFHEMLVYRPSEC